MMNHIDLYKDQIILVTGGAGAIGSNLSRKLAEAGAAKVIILDDLSASYKWNIPNLPNVIFVEGVSRTILTLNGSFAKNLLTFFTWQRFSQTKIL